MTKEAPSVHLVVPCYRESARIGGFLLELCRGMTDLGGVKIQVVEDGSDAEEAALMSNVVDTLRADFPCLLPLNALPGNLGKGGAVYAGWADHGGAEWLGFVDADGACSANEVARLISQLPNPCPMPSAFFASRIKMLGRKVERLLKRHLVGRVYATLVSELLDIPVYDSQCGLKLVPRMAYERVADRLEITGFAFDVELMVALLDNGCRIEEVPIDWSEVPGGKVKLFSDSWRMARDVWRVRRKRTAGKFAPLGDLSLR
jgi:hypothetical protein